MDIGAWLRDLGLGQYEQAFRDNDIDGDVLADLTAEDLSGLGIASIGHRRKLLAAIAALRAGSPHAISPSARAGTTISGAAVPSPEAERRQLTVMFVDLVGSTALAARLDPEDMRDVIGTYHRRIDEMVGRFGGFVAKYMGDGVRLISAGPRLTKPMPSAQYAPHWPRWKRSARSRQPVSGCPHASASPVASPSSATCWVPAPHRSRP